MRAPALHARLIPETGREGELDAKTALALPTSLPTIETLLGKANDRGDVRAARLRGDAARQRVGAADRGWVPLPSLMAGAMTADLGNQTGTGYVAGHLATVARVRRHAIVYLWLWPRVQKPKLLAANRRRFGR